MADQRKPNPAIEARLDTPLPAVVLEQWTGIDRWPVFPVFYLAPLFDAEGDRFVECQTHEEATAAATILSTCSGWPTQVRTKAS